LLLRHASGEPCAHFAGLFAATDFHFAAVLCAFAFGLAEGLDKLFKLNQIHHVYGIILGHISELVAVSVALVHVPDTLEGLLALAHITTHKGEARSLDADVVVVNADVRRGAVVGAVVGGALDAHVVAEVVLTRDARVLHVRDVVDGEGRHWSVPLSFILIRV